MFKTLYAVCLGSRIDGGAPGYFAIAICETREDAEVIKKDLNDYIARSEENQENIDYPVYEYDIFDYAEKRALSFGYYEEISSKPYIKEITVITKDKGSSYIPFLNEKAEKIRRELNSK